MEKIKFISEKPKNKKIEINDTIIEIIPFITLAEQMVLIDRYIKTYLNVEPMENNILFEKIKVNFIEADFLLKINIITLLTNIEVVDYDIFEYSDLFEKIKSNIINYSNFENNLKIAKEELKFKLTQDSSSSKMLEEIAQSVISQFSEIKNISVEDMKDIQNKASEITDSLKNINI